MESVKEKQNKIFESFKDKFGYKSIMQSPKLTKVVISTGIGSIKDKNKIKVIEDRLMKITGQKPSARSAKKSIASFKLREGDVVGYQVTLRGERMVNFIDKLINTALPRTKDFRGISIESTDGMGNYTLGIKEHTIFPETADEDLRDVFSLAITFVTTAKTKEEAKEFFTFIGLPFKKAK